MRRLKSFNSIGIPQNASPRPATAERFAGQDVRTVCKRKSASSPAQHDYGWAHYAVYVRDPFFFWALSTGAAGKVNSDGDAKRLKLRSDITQA